jgi:adenine-specific DNA-methyltransferase
MNSLLEKEGMAGKVQMIYIDPPYGIKYGSNFQPFVNKRDVKDGSDEDLTQEPEMVKAFRDTWELGIHSYLAYLRDRLLLARELLHESGSVFVQISDENIHLIRNLMDEVFGKEQFVVIVCYRRLGMMVGSGVQSSAHYLIWYSKSKNDLKQHKLFKEQIAGIGTGDHYTQRDGKGDYQLISLSTGGFRPKTTINYEFEGNIYHPGQNKCWRTTKEGLDLLKDENRIARAGNTIRYKQYLSDFPYTEITTIWDDTGRDFQNIYVVQTPSLIIKRCILLTTDPGDLILDPTCGSGTTAFVAEQYGRRWITCDTSRVAITLAKQRLMTAVFDYYELAQPREGVGSGFRYKTIPHITLKSIANSEPPAQETLYDQPFIDSSRARVSGPFTVEAVPAPIVKPLIDITPDIPADESIARTGETLRQGEWRDEIFRTGIRGKGGQKIEFTRIESLPAGPKFYYLHADAETKEASPQRAVISFGPDHAPLEQRQVELAIQEAQRLKPNPKMIIFAAFHFDPEATKDIDEVEWPGVTLLKVQMNGDLLTEDLKKKRSSNESFWLMGQPEIIVETIGEGEEKGKYQVKVLGFDYYDTRKGDVISGGTDKIAMWMLDTDYDSRSLFPRQVFFPMAGEKEGWSRLARNLRAEIDEELIEAYRGTVSLPFEPGPNRQIAVKIIDDRGIESLRILHLEDQ